MTFYSVLVAVCRVFFYIFNGRPIIRGQENIPKGDAVILASTHRSMTDPFFLAFAVYPTQVSFMAKQSLFNFKPLGWLLRTAGMFPVNRDSPSSASIRKAVNVMNEDGNHLGIYPSGSRHTTEIKGGTAFIQRMGKRDIVPVVVQPPVGFWQFITRKKAKINFGEPITFDPDIKYDKQKLKEVDTHLKHRFDYLDKQLDPDYVYLPSKTEE